MGGKGTAGGTKGAPHPNPTGPEMPKSEESDCSARLASVWWVGRGHSRWREPFQHQGSNGAGQGSSRCGWRWMMHCANWAVRSWGLDWSLGLYLGLGGMEGWWIPPPVSTRRVCLDFPSTSRRSGWQGPTALIDATSPWLLVRGVRGGKGGEGGWHWLAGNLDQAWRKQMPLSRETWRHLMGGWFCVAAVGCGDEGKTPGEPQRGVPWCPGHCLLVWSRQVCWLGWLTGQQGCDMMCLASSMRASRSLGWHNIKASWTCAGKEHWNILSKMEGLWSPRSLDMWFANCKGSAGSGYSLDEKCLEAVVVVISGDPVQGVGGRLGVH